MEKTRFVYIAMITCNFKIVDKRLSKALMRISAIEIILNKSLDILR